MPLRLVRDAPRRRRGRRRRGRRRSSRRPRSPSRPPRRASRAKCGRRCRSPARRRASPSSSQVRVAAAPRGCSRATPRAGRLVAAERAADRERLAGDDAEHRVALVHRVRVEDPRHHRWRRCRRPGAGMSFSGPISLMISVVKRRVIRSSSRAREQLRVADDAALGAAERQAHQRALPRHPHRERLDLVERDAGVVADAALRRAARDVVRDALAREDADRCRRPSSSGSRPRPTSCTAPRTSTRFVVDAERLGRRCAAAAAPSRRGSRAGAWHASASSALASRLARMPRRESTAQRDREADGRAARPAATGGRRRAAARSGPAASALPRGPRPVMPNA